MSFAGVIGAGIGVVVKLASNSMRKLPFRREPWDYPLFMMVGAWAGYKYVSLEESMLARVNEKRAALDKPPMQLGGLLDLKKWGSE